MTPKRLLLLLLSLSLASTIKAFAPISSTPRGASVKPLTQLESSIPYNDFQQGPISPPSFGGFLNDGSSSVVPETTSTSAPPSVSPYAQVDRYGIHQVTTFRQLQNLIEVNPDKALILQFYAPWCQACKAFHHKFRLFCSRNQITTGTGGATTTTGPSEAATTITNNSNVIVAQVRCQRKSDALCQQMGVTRFPSIQCYQPNGNLMMDIGCGNNNDWRQLQQQQLLQFVQDPDKGSSLVENVAPSPTTSSPKSNFRVTKWIGGCIHCLASSCISVVRYPFGFLWSSSSSSKADQYK